MIADALKTSKLTPRQKNELIGELSNLLCCHQAESISKHLISFDGEKRSRSSIIYNVDVIERAIDENKQVSFLYFDYNEKHEKVYRKNGGRYVMNPVIMVWDRNNYYMLCFSDNHENMITYRLDKMDDIQIAEKDRTPHAEYELFNTEEYRRQAFSMFGGELKNVTILFELSILSNIFDRFGDDIKIVRLDEKTYSVALQVQISKTFFAWVVGTQEKVKIKSPQGVVDEFNAFVSKIKEEY